MLPPQHEWASRWLGMSAGRGCLVQGWHTGLIAVIRVGLRVGLCVEPCVTGPCLHHTLLLLPRSTGEHHPFPGSATCPGCCNVTAPMGESWDQWGWHKIASKELRMSQIPCSSLHLQKDLSSLTASLGWQLLNLQLHSVQGHCSMDLKLSTLLFWLVEQGGRRKRLS